MGAWRSSWLSSSCWCLCGRLFRGVSSISMGVPVLCPAACPPGQLVVPPAGLGRRLSLFPRPQPLLLQPVPCHLRCLLQQWRAPVMLGAAEPWRPLPATARVPLLARTSVAQPVVLFSPPAAALSPTPWSHRREARPRPPPLIGRVAVCLSLSPATSFRGVSGVSGCLDVCRGVVVLVVQLWQAPQWSRRARGGDSHHRLRFSSGSTAMEEQA